MDDRALRIVVLDGRGDPYADEVTAAVAEALSSEAPADRGRGGGAERGGTPEALLHDADAAVVLDDGSLLRAREAGTPLCVALLPGFDVAWAGDLAEADRVLVAHQMLVGAVVRRGALREHVVVTGPVAPAGFDPAADPDEARRAAGLDHRGPLVLVPGSALEEHGPDSVLIQLGLVSNDAGFLFDVGNDPDAAETLRRLVPIHGLTAWMFAEERGAGRWWALADLVVGRPRGYEIPRALAVGAPLVLLPPGRSDASAVDALEAAGVARDADVLATLAVTIDAALEPAALAEGRDAVRALEVRGSAARVAESVREAWQRRKATGAEGPPRGLPHGLERLPSSRSERPPAGRSSAPPPDEDLEARIDRELAELKKRLD